MKDSTKLRREHNALRSMIFIALDELLQKNNTTLVLNDDQGSLIVNQIDDQESEVIQRIYIKHNTPQTTIIMAVIGVYDESYEVPIGDYCTDILLNILQAAEEASV